MDSMRNARTHVCYYGVWTLGSSPSPPNEIWLIEITVSLLAPLQVASERISSVRIVRAFAQEEAEIDRYVLLSSACSSGTFISPGALRMRG